MGGIFYKNYSVSRKCLGIEGVSPEYKFHVCPVHGITNSINNFSLK
jgi:hypothetical protein